MLMTKSRFKSNPLMIVLINEMCMPHGTEMLAALVIDEARRRNWEVILFTAFFAPARSAWLKFLKDRKVKVYHPFFWRLTRYYLPHRIIMRWLQFVIKIRKPTLIWSPDNEITTCLALDKMDNKIIPFFVHDPNEASNKYPDYQKLWFKVCIKVTALSVHGTRQLESAKDYYLLNKPIEKIFPASFPPGRKIVYPCSQNGTIRFAHFGRLHTQKGLPFLLGAFSRLLMLYHKGAELHLFGDGPEKQSLKKIAINLNLEKKIIFHGGYEPKDLDNLIESIDVGIMSSLYEGFGLVMLELMSRGRPVISTDVGSSREVLEGLGGGWVIRRADTEALAQAMKFCCENPDMVKTKGIIAQKVWSENFKPEHMFERYVNFWKKWGANI